MPNQDSIEELYLKYPFLRDPEDWYYVFENKGKKAFGENFYLDPYDYNVIVRLENFIGKDPRRAIECNVNLNKGIFLIGPIGCGKTSFILILRTYVKNESEFKFISAIDLSNEFSIEGPIIIQNYVNSYKILCIDDIGREELGHYYGRKTNVIAEILRGRYDRKLKGDMIWTHATSNFGIDDLMTYYGEDICSRMKTLFNLIAFHPNSKDKRH